MPRTKKSPAVLEIDQAAVLNRIAWLRWQGRATEARAVVDLCAWMRPIFRPDDHEAEIADRIAELELNQRQAGDPLHWD